MLFPGVKFEIDFSYRHTPLGKFRNIEIGLVRCLAEILLILLSAKA